MSSMNLTSQSNSVSDTSSKSLVSDHLIVDAIGKRTGAYT